MVDTMGILFSEKHDAKLNDLTAMRSIAALPIAGRYRLIDFTLSNMVNSGIINVGVCTQHNYSSLMDHVGAGTPWDLNRKRKGLFVLPPYIGKDYSSRGGDEIDVLNGILSYIRRSDETYVIIAHCNKVCNMTFNPVLEYHKLKKADITIVYSKVPELNKRFSKYNMIKTNPDGRVVDVEVNSMYTKSYKAFMDVTIINKAMLERIVVEMVSRGEYGTIVDILLRKMNTMKIYGYEYKGYMGVVDDIPSYYENNMNMLQENVRNELFNSRNSIYTKIKDSVPTKYGNGAIVRDCLVADGCNIEGEIENSIVFRGVKIGKDTKIKNSIIMQNTSIAEGCTLENVILDKEVFVRSDKMLIGQEVLPFIVSKRMII